MYDVDDLLLAKEQLRLARETRDTDEITAAQQWLREVLKHLDREPVYDHDEVSAYDLILQGT